MVLVIDSNQKEVKMFSIKIKLLVIEIHLILFADNKEASVSLQLELPQKVKDFLSSASENQEKQID